VHLSTASPRDSTRRTGGMSRRSGSPCPPPWTTYGPPKKRSPSGSPNRCLSRNTLNGLPARAGDGRTQKHCHRTKAQSEQGDGRTAEEKERDGVDACQARDVERERSDPNLVDLPEQHVQAEPEGQIEDL